MKSQENKVHYYEQQPGNIVQGSIIVSLHGFHTVQSSNLKVALLTSWISNVFCYEISRL